LLLLFFVSVQDEAYDSWFGEIAMTFEIMEPKHLPELTQLYVKTYNAPPWFDEWNEETVMQKLSQMMHCEGFLGIVSKDLHEAITGMIVGEKEIYFNCIQFFIKDFCVAHDLKGTGIGSELLRELERQLISMGIRRMYLFTSRTDDTEGFYQKRGFTSWDDMVMMGKTIQETQP
jgi:N-acetylglutamate synthase-like GNAT family acetyltransferase